MRDHESPDILTDGEWRPGRHGIRVWVPAVQTLVSVMVAVTRYCETCARDISHKRSDARFCSRLCKNRVIRCGGKTTEEAQFTDEELRALNAAYVRGERDDHTVLGARVYKRLHRRRQREERAA